MRCSALDIGCKVLLRVLMGFQLFRALVELVGEKAIYEKKCKKKGKTQNKTQRIHFKLFAYKHRHFMYGIKMGKEIKTLHFKKKKPCQLCQFQS